MYIDKNRNFKGILRSSVSKIAQKKISLCRFEIKRTHLKSIWKFIVAQQALFYKSLLILSSSICLLYLFPRGGQFKYEFQKGRVWQYPSYYAPFDFSILKTEAEIQSDREEVVTVDVPIDCSKKPTVPDCMVIIKVSVPLVVPERANVKRP